MPRTIPVGNRMPHATAWTRIWIHSIESWSQSAEVPATGSIQTHDRVVGNGVPLGDVVHVMFVCSC